MTAKSTGLLTSLAFFLILFSSINANADPPDKVAQHLLHAIVQDQVDVVEGLLDQSGDPNARIKPDKEDVWLLKSRPGDDPAQPLIVRACGYGCLGSKVIQLLIDRGANVNITDKNGVTPLMMASELDWDPSISLLLEHGANR